MRYPFDLRPAGTVSRETSSRGSRVRMNDMPNLSKSIATALLLSIALLVFGVEVIAPQLPPYAGTPDARTTRILDLPAAGRLELRAVDGSIRVAVNDDPAALRCAISADIRLYRIGALSEHQDPAAYLARVVSAEADGDVIRVRSLPQDWPAEIAAVVKYTVTVPRGTDIDVRGVNGNVWVAEGCGKVSVESGNADVEVLNPSGPVVARSTNGRLRLAGGRGSSVLETVNGNIRADMIEGSLSASSVNGRVQAEVLGPAVIACALRSENGDVRVGLGADVGYTLDANAARGEVLGEAGLAIDPASPDSFRATEGSGDTRLTLASANGSIQLTRR